MSSIYVNPKIHYVLLAAGCREVMWIKRTYWDIKAKVNGYYGTLEICRLFRAGQ